MILLNQESRSYNKSNACPINSSDRYNFAGKYGSKPPIVPGYEGAGTIVKLGEDVSSDLFIKKLTCSMNAFTEKKSMGDGNNA